MAKKPNEVTMLDIIQIMEKTSKINRCLEEDRYCSRFATETCPVRNFYSVLQEELEQKLTAMTIQGLLDSSRPQ